MVELEPRTLVSGLVVGESPRWHDGRLWPFTQRTIRARDQQDRDPGARDEPGAGCVGRRDEARVAPRLRRAPGIHGRIEVIADARTKKNPSKRP